jgi:hypothetical protein
MSGGLKSDVQCKIPCLNFPYPEHIKLSPISVILHIYRTPYIQHFLQSYGFTNFPVFSEFSNFRTTYTVAHTPCRPCNLSLLYPYQKHPMQMV